MGNNLRMCRQGTLLTDCVAKQETIHIVKLIWLGDWPYRELLQAEELDQTQAFLADESLEQLCRVIFNLNEFVYPE